MFNKTRGFLTHCFHQMRGTDKQEMDRLADHLASTVRAWTKEFGGDARPVIYAAPSAITDRLEDWAPRCPQCRECTPVLVEPSGLCVILLDGE